MDSICPLSPPRVVFRLTARGLFDARVHRAACVAGTRLQKRSPTGRMSERCSTVMASRPTNRREAYDRSGDARRCCAAHLRHKSGTESDCDTRLPLSPSSSGQGLNWGRLHASRMQSRCLADPLQRRRRGRPSLYWMRADGASATGNCCDDPPSKCDLEKATAIMEMISLVSCRPQVELTPIRDRVAPGLPNRGVVRRAPLPGWATPRPEACDEEPKSLYALIGVINGSLVVLPFWKGSPAI